MLDVFGLPSATRGDRQVFGPNAASDGVGWATWNKPRGCSMAAFYVVGSGGGGGNGVVGANSAAAGGGGGGSGGQTFVSIPLVFLPDILYVSVGMGLNAAGVESRIAISPIGVVANNCLARATGGGVGGTAVGVTAGGAGGAAAVATIATMPLAGMGTFQLLAGHAGIIGGTTVAGAALTLPVTGLCVTGGAGGGGLPAAANAGSAGGGFVVVGLFPAHSGAGQQTTATLPGGNGSNGPDRVIRGLEYSYGGTGGGSSHGSATGAGLFGGQGGAGGIGSGGGGGGGCLTGGTAGVGGRGGDGQVYIICW